MNKFVVLLVVILSLVSQAAANTVADTHDLGVVSAMLTEPYVAALLSLLVLIATLI
jgi:hypothetical protein